MCVLLQTVSLREHCLLALEKGLLYFTQLYFSQPATITWPCHQSGSSKPSDVDKLCPIKTIKSQYWFEFRTSLRKKLLTPADLRFGVVLDGLDGVTIW